MPAEEYLKSLEPKLLSKILRTIELLRNSGNYLRLPYSKSLGDGIFELRTKQSTNITRILYFFFSGNRAILTNGFTKKSQETPLRELYLAKKYKLEYKRGIQMTNYDDFKKKALQNPEVKKEYDALGPEYDLIQAMIDARIQQNLTQKELSNITGITQADISRIENGTRNPSLNMIKRIAQGLGMRLKLEFIKTPIQR